MDDLPFQWYNLHDHHQEQSLDFDSENIMFMNPIHHLASINWTDQAMAAADLSCSNGFLERKNQISISPQSMEYCLLSGTNSSTDCKTMWHNIGGVSSGDSVKDIDDGAVSQCSSGKRPVTGTGFSENPPKPKRSRSDPGRPTSSNINFQQPGTSSETDSEAIAQMKEIIYREAAFRPVSFAAETAVDKPKRKNVRISSDPQTVAARRRRERVSERIRVLQKLVPGGNKMDTASMLDEAANYLKFLRSQVKALEQNSTTVNAHGTMIPNHNARASMVVPFSPNPFPMQTHVSFLHQNLYPTREE